MQAALPAPRASQLRQPGLDAWPAGTERHRIAGGTQHTVQLQAGDRVQLIDTEGAQPVVLRWRDAQGERDVPGFSDESPAGNTLAFSAECDTTLTIDVRGTAMLPWDTTPPTAIELQVQRVSPTTTHALPAPLGEVVQSIRIAAGTAQAYRVKAGEWVQVIDVEGRQCSDFQAFPADRLQEGLGIDATVTRTLLGRASPTPGLPAKAFSQRFTPLVELVQDTCGRHDAFATACSSRYYDDLGYPGHVNCSDNFNAALAPFGVPPRKAWEALNFFYNTAIDAGSEQLTLDEPWSRPGDHVLLRALTDLVCVSSSCPDDIDAANGWQPTDIHVRIYAASEQFPRLLAHRMSPDAPPQTTRESAFHPRTSALTQQFTDYRGWWLPQRFSATGVIDEYWACREAVVVMDLSALRKFEITGPDAEALLQWTLTRDVRKVSVGQVVYTAICHPHGGVMDDGTLFRLTEHNFRLVCGDEFTGQWLREQAAAKGYRAWVRSSTEQLHNLAVQGPRSRELLQALLWTAPTQVPLAELPWFRFAPARLSHFEGAPLVVSRTGYTGELGYELFCHPKDALTLWDAIWQAGQPLGLKPMGLEALDRVRIEAGLVFANQEFDDGTDPFEAGIGFTVPLKSKEVDFIGREALLARKEHPRHVIVGLELDVNEAVHHGDCVHIGRAQVGVVTSGCWSPVLNKSIALARVEPGAAALDTAIEVGRLDGHQQRLPGRVVRFPHYDPDKTRVRS